MLKKSPVYAYIPAKDLDRARRFYEQKLGFQPKMEIGGGVVYDCADKRSPIRRVACIRAQRRSARTPA